MTIYDLDPEIHADIIADLMEDLDMRFYPEEEFSANEDWQNQHVDDDSPF